MTLAALLGLGLAVSPADAQPAAESMTCAAAVDYFARNRVIYKTVHGKPLPIRIGTPVAATSALDCRGRGRMQRRYTVKTTDQPRCVVSLYCE